MAIPFASYSIGSTPSDEPCAQTGVTADWIMLQQLECEVYRAALIARFGVPPEGARLAIKTHSHDFGSYAEVEIRFDRDVAEHVAYFELVEGGLGSWLEANFTAPVLYDRRGQPQQGTIRPAIDCVVGALMTSLRLVSDGFATDREQLAVANLSRAYPACAVLAVERLRDAGIIVGCDGDIDSGTYGHCPLGMCGVAHQPAQQGLSL